jgi:hypothetical protein
VSKTATTTAPDHHVHECLDVLDVRTIRVPTDHRAVAPIAATTVAESSESPAPLETVSGPPTNRRATSSPYLSRAATSTSRKQLQRDGLLE